MNANIRALGVSCLIGAAALLNPASAPAGEWKPAEGPLKTRWSKDVDPRKPHPEYPRPQMERKQWMNLNGLWEMAIVPKNAGKPSAFDTSILVPFPVESALSGVMKPVSENEQIWYRRVFQLPGDWHGKRLMLNFGAVDFETRVWVNGKEVGSHTGGYDAFSFDITDATVPVGENEVVVAVWDPTDAGTQPRGKQIRKPHGIWYTPTSGIWQTVWLEPVSSAHIKSLKIVPDIDSGVVRVKAITTATLGRFDIEATVRDGKKVIATAMVPPGGTLVLPIKKARLWSPETPHLYSLSVNLKLGRESLDSVESYFGMRKISLGKDERGFTRLMLNNKPYFQLGPLDQGFWPDGLYTAPTDEALRFDIEITKKLGFNMARKHVKIEPSRWYYWCDKLGLLVWQDMPSGDKYIGGNDPDIQRSPESAAQFEKELTAMVMNLGNHPSIVMWVPYNEGWGQWDTARIVNMVKELDPSRLVNNASGWTDRGVGDVNDIHRYPGPAAPEPEPVRAGVLGEFGGLGLPLAGHTWQSEKNWGYRSFTNAAALAGAYVDLMARLFPLIRTKGLSAAVYTQTTDVEVEVNGLLTYDREVIKMPIDVVRSVNFGNIPPRPRIVDVLPTAQTERNVWRYTTEKPAAGWETPGFDAANWKQGQAGFGTRGTPGAIVRTPWNTGEIWLRREFDIQAKPGQKLRLFMHHDEDAVVYINGKLATKAAGYSSDYGQFDIAPEALTTLKERGNLLAIHCRQTSGGQYIDAGIVRVDPPGK